ncbi:MAG: endonuclease/exonuclease/phosphatase family protein [Dehalococcoidia bacterium]|nr:endonuclease/exonuclease/phosphatase family protein [Dehalococcoidia bacterium]
MVSLRVVTFNLRNVNDRYAERRSLLIDAFAAIGADVAGLQEVSFAAGERQDDLLAAAGRAHPARSLQARSERYPDFGLAILVAVGDVLVHETVSLGHRRVAQRALVALPEGRSLWFANTHLHHRPKEPEVRADQARLLAEWLAAAPAADAIVAVGDFNAPPSEPACAVMRASGFRSAFAEATGEEPRVTWPSGIQAPTMDTDGEPNCLDYVWLAGSVAAKAACIAANEPAADDATLYPSDHFAVVIDVVVGGGSGAR